MPNMDGITATKEIRAASVMRPDAGKIPIIAMTANAFDEDAKRCSDAGMTAHLSKPLQMEKVIRIIAQCCGEADVQITNSYGLLMVKMAMKNGKLKK